MIELRDQQRNLLVFLTQFIDESFEFYQLFTSIRLLADPIRTQSRGNVHFLFLYLQYLTKQGKTDYRTGKNILSSTISQNLSSMANGEILITFKVRDRKVVLIEKAKIEKTKP